MALPCRGKSAGREVKELGPFGKVSEVYVTACESTFGELSMDVSGERGSQGPNPSGFAIHSEDCGVTFYLLRGVWIVLLFGKFTPITMGKGRR